MATQKQIEANRRNAQKSTGPTSETGKAVSRLNALKSGIDAKLAIITGENEQSLDELRDAFYRDHQPQTAMECALLDDVIRDTWMLQRFFHIDAELINYEIATDLYRDKTQHPLGKAFRASSQHQIRLQRRIDSTRKSQINTFKEFQRLQEERRAHPPAAQAQPPAGLLDVTASPARPNPQIGFVPDSAPEAPQPEPIPAPPAPESRPRFGFYARR